MLETAMQMFAKGVILGAFLVGVASGLTFTLWFTWWLMDTYEDWRLNYEQRRYERKRKQELQERERERQLLES